MSKIEIRKLDGKNRITIPVSNSSNKTLFVSNSNGLILLHEDEKEIQHVLDILRKEKRKKRKKALIEWSEAVKESGLTDISSKEIDQRVLNQMKKGLPNDK